MDWSFTAPGLLDRLEAADDATLDTVPFGIVASRPGRPRQIRTWRNVVGLGVIHAPQPVAGQIHRPAADFDPPLAVILHFGRAPALDVVARCVGSRHRKAGAFPRIKSAHDVHHLPVAGALQQAGGDGAAIAALAMHQ